MRKLACVLLLAALAAPALATPVSDGLVLWLDASDLATVIDDGGGKVQEWRDKSPNRYHAGQTDPDRRPVYNATALNGQPAVRFDGSSADLLTNDGLLIDTSLSLARPYTAFIVDQYWGSQQGRTLQGRGVNWLMGKWNGQNAHFANGWVSSSGANPAGTGDPAIGEATGNTTSSAYYINGANKTISSTPTGAPGNLQIGVVDYPPGNPPYDEGGQADVAEVLIYDRVLSWTEHTRVGNYLADKYGLATSYPRIHLGDVGAFTGADPGEGLDLQGEFPYALNLAGPKTHVGDRVFTQGNATAGASVASQAAANPWFDPPDYGTSAADDGLETVMHSIRWSYAAGTPQPTVELDVLPGARYKVQMLFSENILNRPPGSRVQDVKVEGQLAVDNLDLNAVMGTFTAAPVNKGVVYTHELVATDGKLTLQLGPGAGGTDHNPIVQAVTLEDLDARVGAFAGADPSEGLDLDGRFRYAVNLRGPQTQVGNLLFTQDGGPGTTASTPGVTVEAGSGSGYYTWDTKPDYGTSAADDGLETVMHSIRYCNAGLSPHHVGLDMDVTPGRRYRLQLLFSENILGRGPGSRVFDVNLEGVRVRDELDLNAIMGQFTATPIDKGVLYTREFLATDSTLNIILSPGTSGTDAGPILQAATLEDLSPALWATGVRVFRGGDPNEGLVFDGDFVYAVDAGGDGGFQIGDAVFTNDTAPGVTLNAQHRIPNWKTFTYGSSADDNALETLMKSIRYSTSYDGILPLDVSIALADLVPGTDYELQLLFGEGTSNRGFDVFIEGMLVADDFSPYALTGIDLTKGVVLTHQFTALDDTLEILLDGLGTPFPDKNPIIQGLTLKIIPEPASMSLLALGLLALLRRRRA